jgi:GH25 family lysozyme M1 (1,4-beta-N-acetylmuramidase)
MATTLALAGGTLALGASAAGASITASAAGSPGSHAKIVRAMTASGRAVPVAAPASVPAPVQPENITHPRLDFMGSTIPRYLRAPAGPAPSPAAATPQLPGIDVSGYQGNINWASIARYLDFAYAKATEGTRYTNPYFYNQYVGPYANHVIRGSYHFAIPDNSSGKTQADYFIAHGGGWSADGRTLPGALDVEYNPYGPECYGLTQSQMVSWIWNFVTEYAYREHAYPVIYSTTDWWTTCTGSNGGFGRYDPLWIANYSASHGGPLPGGWGFYTFWQYTDHGSLPGDQNVFNGPYSRLQVLAAKG